MEIKQPTKKLPNAPTKKQAVDIFLKIGHPEAYIKRVINEIINDIGRKHKKTKFCKNLLQDEFKEAVNILGIPTGYSW